MFRTVVGKYVTGKVEATSGLPPLRKFYGNSPLHCSSRFPQDLHICDKACDVLLGDGAWLACKMIDLWSIDAGGMSVTDDRPASSNTRSALHPHCDNHRCYRKSDMKTRRKLRSAVLFQPTCCSDASMYRFDYLIVSYWLSQYRLYSRVLPLVSAIEQ